MNIWKKVDGYKTLTGVLALAFAWTNLSKYISPEEVNELVNALITLFGLVTTIIGIIHKAYKKIES